MFYQQAYALYAEQRQLLRPVHNLENGLFSRSDETKQQSENSWLNLSKNLEGLFYFKTCGTFTYNETMIPVIGLGFYYSPYSVDLIRSHSAVVIWI